MDDTGLVDILHVMSTATFASDNLPDGSVSEIYSPPRVAPLAPEFGFHQGDSMDLLTNDPKRQTLGFWG